MASPSPAPRSHSRNSFYSTTTYHSFQDVELYDTSSASRATGLGLSAAVDAPIRRLRPSRKDDLDHPSSFQMVRQDSGYESSTPPPRSSHSSRRARHVSSSSSSSSSKQRTAAAAASSSSTTTTCTTTTRAARAPKRPALRRTTASGPVSHLPARSSLTIPRTHSLPVAPRQQQTVQRKHSYFQFPSPDNLLVDDPSTTTTAASRPKSRQKSIDLAPVIRTVNTANENSNRSPDPNAARRTSSSSSSSSSSASSSAAAAAAAAHSHPAQHPFSSSPPPHPIAESPVSPYAPPQTTHYWTSDRTRRLEYAAIDAASRGVRGWVMRNMVPECFVPREKRRVGFDDDSGSVRRYRLDLEIECPEESVPPSPVGEKLTGFRARAAGRGSWWARLRGCT